LTPHLKAVFLHHLHPRRHASIRKTDRPLYYIGYIRSSEVSHIQVDLGFALSIMSHKIMQHSGIPTHRLSTTQTTIYVFNANGTRPMGKIKLRCQIGDLRCEMTRYVIDTDTSYNLLLGRSWIHRNSIIPSTLHQVRKYVDEDGKVRTLIAERYPFKGVKNYFTDFLLYQDSLETNENPHPEEPTLATMQIQSQKKKSVSEK